MTSYKGKKNSNENPPAGSEQEELIKKGYVNHANRKDLGGEHPLGDLLQGIFMIIFFVIWGVDSFLLQIGPDLTRFVPLWARILLGLSLLIGCIYLAAITLKIIFGEIRDPPIVIKDGPYKYSRHPMYFASIMLHFSFFLFTLSLLSLGVWFAIIGLYWWLAVDEERKLLEKFGKKYEEYQKHTRMWI